MLTIEETRERILDSLGTVGTEVVAISAALDRILAAPIQARLDQPASDLSAMDGFAVRAAQASLGALLPLAGEAPAGQPLACNLPEESAVRLFTGSVIPEGADTVLVQEHATITGVYVRVDVAAMRGRHIRARGGDFSCHDVVLTPGTRLGVRALALAAAANHPFAIVRRRPRVALLATGDELVLPGEPIRQGGLPSSVSWALTELITQSGGDPVVLPIIPDDERAISNAVLSAGNCDLLVTIGGASVGERDIVRRTLTKTFGLKTDVLNVAMRPGKPLLRGSVCIGTKEMSVIGLPGNPVAALLCGALFVRPAIATMLGLTPEAPTEHAVRLGASVDANGARVDHLRALLLPEPGDIPTAMPIPVQDSSRLYDLARAGALILRPPHAPALPEGAVTKALFLDEVGL